MDDATHSDALAQVIGWGAALARRRPRGLFARAGVQVLMRAPARELEFRDASGHHHQVDSRDQMGANALLGRYRLPEAVAAQVPAGGLAVDCGANIGIITSQLCELVGSSGTVWAVEPVPANVRRLNHLRERNGLRHLEVISVAVGAADGTASLGLADTGRSGWASITKSWGVAGRVDVPVRTIDGLVADRSDGKPVTFLKLDVEGYEFEAMEGAARVLGEHRPLVYCEFNDVLLRDRGRSSDELLGRFAELGYAPAPGHLPAPSALRGRVVNILLVPA